MKTKMTKAEALVIQFLLAFLPFLHVNAVDPVFFLISNTFVENKTLIPLPQDFQFKGDQVNDCCTLQIFVTVTDYEGPDEGSGIEPSKETESQAETGEITFQFDHPDIRNEDVSFAVAVNEKNEGPTRHILQFDKCLKLAQKTFNFSAASTMATMKDVKVVVVNGKDDNIVCTNTNVTPSTLNYTSQNETATKPPTHNYNTLWKTLLAISWVIIVILVGVCLYMRRQAQTNGNIQNTDNQECMQVLNMGPDIQNHQNNQIHEESEEQDEKTERYEPGDSTSDSDEERSKEDQTKSITRNKLRGGRTGASNSVPSVKPGDSGKCQWIAKICKNKPLFFMSVFTCVWFIGCVIATGIIVPFKLSQN